MATEQHANLFWEKKQLETAVTFGFETKSGDLANLSKKQFKTAFRHFASATICLHLSGRQLWRHMYGL